MTSAAPSLTTFVTLPSNVVTSWQVVHFSLVGESFHLSASLPKLLPARSVHATWHLIHSMGVVVIVLSPDINGKATVL